MRIVLLIACLSFLVAAGCSEKKAPTKVKPSEGKSITIGLIPEQNIFRQMERYEPLAKYVSNKIGVKIKLKVLPRYGNIISNFVSEGMDGAFFGSFSKIQVEAGVEGFVRDIVDNPGDELGIW